MNIVNRRITLRKYLLLFFIGFMMDVGAAPITAYDQLDVGENKIASDTEIKWVEGVEGAADFLKKAFPFAKLGRDDWRKAKSLQKAINGELNKDLGRDKKHDDDEGKIKTRDRLKKLGALAAAFEIARDSQNKLTNLIDGLDGSEYQPPATADNLPFVVNQLVPVYFPKSSETAKKPIPVFRIKNGSMPNTIPENNGDLPIETKETLESLVSSMKPGDILKIHFFDSFPPASVSDIAFYTGDMAIYVTDTLAYILQANPFWMNGGYSQKSFEEFVKKALTKIDEAETIAKAALDKATAAGKEASETSNKIEVITGQLKEFAKVRLTLTSLRNELFQSAKGLDEKEYGTTTKLTITKRVEDILTRIDEISNTRAVDVFNFSSLQGADNAGQAIEVANNALAKVERDKLGIATWLGSGAAPRKANYVLVLEKENKNGQDSIKIGIIPISNVYAKVTSADQVQNILNQFSLNSNKDIKGITASQAFDRKQMMAPYQLGDLAVTVLKEAAMKVVEEKAKTATAKPAEAAAKAAPTKQAEVAKPVEPAKPAAGSGAASLSGVAASSADRPGLKRTNSAPAGPNEAAKAAAPTKEQIQGSLGKQ